MKQTVITWILVALAAFGCSLEVGCVPISAADQTKEKVDAERREVAKSYTFDISQLDRYSHVVYPAIDHLSGMRFAESQQRDFNALRKDFDAKGTPLLKALDVARKNYYNTVLYRADWKDDEINKVVASLSSREAAWILCKWSALRNIRKLLTPEQAVVWDATNMQPAGMARMYFELSIPLLDLPKFDGNEANNIKITEQQKQEIDGLRENWNQESWNELKSLSKKLVETMENPDWKDEDVADILQKGLSYQIPMLCERLLYQKKVFCVLTADQRNQFWLSQIEAKPVKTVAK